MLALGLCAWSAPVEAQEGAPWAEGGISRPEDLVISVAIFGPGDEIFQYFGHAAIEVRDDALGASALYNFGTFGFGSDMLPRFVMGRLEFWLGLMRPVDAYHMYIAQDREVRILVLDLTPERRAKLARALAINAEPENRRYLYHHYDDNCSTRIFDVIDAAVDGQLEPAMRAPARMSLREHTRRFASASPLLDWLLVYTMNADMEKEITRRGELFLPDELESAFLDANITDPSGQRHPLVKQVITLNRPVARRPAPERAAPLWPWTLGLGVLGGALFVVAGERRRARAGRGARVALGLMSAAFGFVFGTLGTVLTGLALFTEHTITYYNENLFFAGPWTLVLLPLGFAMMRREAPKAERRLARWWLVLAGIAGVGLALGALPALRQDTLLVTTLLVPVIVGATFGTWRAERRPPRAL